VFFVGGPNQRKDYHLEEGEELFFMRKGDMCLKIQQGGQFVDVPIKEGEVT
jgi:3-hydroxyanthranilate 3,4-dioxygenase